MTQRNVFWFLIDGLSPNYLNVCGRKDIPENFIDQRLKTGTVFSNVYSGNGGTHTSMHIFFSGFYSNVNGATGWSLQALRNFDPNIYTISDIFKHHGYNTYRYCDARGQRCAPKSGFDIWESSGEVVGIALAKSNFMDCQRRTDFINIVNADTKPKFVYHHSFLLHDLNGKLGDVWPSSEYVKNIAITSAHMEKLIKSYDIQPDDIVIISSDHGVMLDQRLSTFWAENGLRHLESSARCFFSLSGKGIPAQVLDKLVSAVDIAPTLMDIVFGFDLKCQGQNLRKYIFEGVYTDTPCYRESGSYFTNPQVSDHSVVFAVRDRNWKYVHATMDNERSEWLMDLEKDQDYSVNLKDELPEIVTRYKGHIESYLRNKIDFEAFNAQHYSGKLPAKKDIPPTVTILVKGDRISENTLDSILDFCGPYFEVLLQKGTTRNTVRHPKVRYVDRIRLAEMKGEYVFQLDGMYQYADYFLSEMYEHVRYHAGNEDTVVQYDKNIFIIHKKNLAKMHNCGILHYEHHEAVMKNVH